MKALKINQGKQKGLAAVETTLVLPLMFLFFAFTVEFGKIYYDYLTLTKLQRNAARYLSMHVDRGPNQLAVLGSGDAQTKIAEAKNLILYGQKTQGIEPTLPGISANSISVTAIDNDHIMITTNYTSTPIFGDLLPNLANLFSAGNDSLQLNVSASSVMKILKD